VWHELNTSSDLKWHNQATIALVFCHNIPNNRLRLVAAQQYEYELGLDYQIA
jgi:hypothetical protein